MAKYGARIKARQMRRKGESLGEIATALSVSKSSVSVWTQDIILTPTQINVLKEKVILAGKGGRWLGTEYNKNKKKESLDRASIWASQQIRQVTQENLMILASALFWSEGSKTGSRFIFVNSDPEMIKTMYIFLIKYMGVKKSDIRLGIQINKIHESRIEKVLKFWMNLLKLPLIQMDKPSYIQVKVAKIYENHDTYYGIARLKVVRSSYLQYQMIALINEIKKQICRGSSVGRASHS